MPLLSWHNFIIEPKYSSGVIIVALIHGSSINFIKVGSEDLMGFEDQQCHHCLSLLYKQLLGLF